MIRIIRSFLFFSFPIPCLRLAGIRNIDNALLAHFRGRVVVSFLFVSTNISHLKALTSRPISISPHRLAPSPCRPVSPSPCLLFIFPLRPKHGNCFVWHISRTGFTLPLSKSTKRPHLKALCHPSLRSAVWRSSFENDSIRESDFPKSDS